MTGTRQWAAQEKKVHTNADLGVLRVSESFLIPLYTQASHAKTWKNRRWKHLSLGTTTARLKLVESFQTGKKWHENNKNETWRQAKAICSLILTFVKFMMLITCKLTGKFNVLCRHTIRIVHTYITATRQIQQRQSKGSDDRRSQLKIGLSNCRAS